MNIKRFPRLYKKSKSSGKITQWDIEIHDNVIITSWGYLDSKIQVTKDTIHEGKNAGKSNETSCEQQAISEAESKWTKNLKKGYCQTLEACIADEVDSVIEGGIVTMLAHTYEKYGHKIIYPVYCSTKIDGIRCVAIKNNNKWTLWSRTRKPIKSMPNIINELNKCKAVNGTVLDGELFSSKVSFEDVIHFTRSDEAQEGHEVIEYHVFDTVLTGPFSDRYEFLELFFEQKFNSIKLVKSYVANSEEEVMELFNEFLEQGHEGLMLRNINSEYEHKRSHNLIKLKLMTDSEYPIIGIHEGRGKDTGTVGKFICITPEGKEFGARLKTSYEKRRELFNNESMWKNKQLTVVYQNLTNDGIPRFPIGKAIRSYE